MHKCCQPFSSERSKTHTQMQLIGISDISVMLKQLIDSTFGIFRFSKLIGDIYLPMREMVIKRCNPLRNPSLSGIYFLTSAYEAYYSSPILTLVERPNQKCGLRHREIRNFEFVAICATTLQIISNALMSPCALCLVKYCHMLNLAIATLLQLNCLVRINLKFAIHHRVLNLCKHVISIAVNNLDKFLHFPARVR